MGIVRDEPIVTVFANKAGMITIHEIDREHGGGPSVCVHPDDVGELIRAIECIQQEIEGPRDA